MNEQVKEPVSQVKAEKPEAEEPKNPLRLTLPRPLYFAFGLIVILLLILGSIKIFQYFKKPTDPTIKYPSQQVIAQVGKETLFGQDLNYEISIYFPETSKSKELVPEEIKQTALDQIVRKSLLLQAALDEGLLTLSNSVFNALNKNYRQRNILLNSIEEKVNAKYVNNVRGEMISIWFKNIYEPKMGLEAARQVTQAKMATIYNDLRFGIIPSLKEAAELIKNDPTLNLIDPSYQGNAYLSFEITAAEKFFIDPKIQDAAFRLTPGELSPMLIGQDQNPGGEFYDAYFIVMRILDRELKGFESFEDWFNQKKENYEVEIKI